MWLETARSLARLSWALGVFGAQQGVRLLSPATGREAAAAFDRVLATLKPAEDGEEARPLWLDTVRCFGGALADMGPMFLSSYLFNPQAWATTALEVGVRSVAALQLLPGGQAAVAGRELAAKVEVFCLVRGVAERIGVPASGVFELAPLVDRAYRLDPFAALWAVEGLGHDYAERCLDAGRSVEGLLHAEATGPLPAKSLLMLHAGFGLAVAQRTLAELPRTADPAALAQATAAIIEHCRLGSLPGFVGAAWESLGLVTRTFHPAWVAAVDATLAANHPDVRGFFWHGVGRALYFLPLNFLPGADAAVFAMARREAPDEPLRRSALAGVAWAFLLVTQRDPEILSQLVVTPLAAELAAEGGFANGVASATVMRLDTTPGAALLESFRAYAPEPAGAAAWRRLVSEPFELATEVLHPALARRGELDAVFRYQDLPALAAALRAEEGR